jgi:hypothetical protein
MMTTSIRSHLTIFARHLDEKASAKSMGTECRGDLVSSRIRLPGDFGWANASIAQKQALLRE